MATTRRRGVTKDSLPKLLDRMYHTARVYVPQSKRIDPRDFSNTLKSCALLVLHLAYVDRQKVFNRWWVVVFGVVRLRRQGSHVEPAPERTAWKGVLQVKVLTSLSLPLLGQARRRPVDTTG